MAIVLTTNWQKIDEKYLGTHDGFSVYVRCYARHIGQNKENNTTTVQVESRLYNAGGTIYSGSGTTASATIDGETESASANRNYGAGETTVAFKQKQIRHNDDGTKTINVSASWSSQPWGWSNTASANVDLPKIDRYPMIITAPDFSDEDNPVITYTTALGFEGATVQVGIFDSTGATPYVSYRTVVVENGSYTFELTDAERNTLRNATPNSNTLVVQFKLKTTTTDNTEYFSTMNKQMSIVNANPTFTYTETETNAKVVAVLGSIGSTVVQNASLLKVAVSPTALKGASVLKVVITHNNISYEDTTSPYSINIPITTNKYTIAVIDSRGNTTQQEITKTMIEYQPIDITNLSMKRVNPTSSNIRVNLEATYYQQTFGSTANVPTVKWKLDNGSYTTIPSSAYTIDTTNNKLTITNYVIQDALVYTSKGTFTISVEDLLTTDQDSRDVLKGIPTFDAGEHDFKVNGTLYIADTNGQNKVNVLNEIESLTQIELYNDATGTTGNVQLSETADNFTYLEIFFECNQYAQIYNSVKVYLPNQKYVSLTSIQADNSAFGIYSANININGTSITKTNGGVYWTNSGYTHTDYIYITRVIGYK